MVTLSARSYILYTQTDTHNLSPLPSYTIHHPTTPYTVHPSRLWQPLRLVRIESHRRLSLANPKPREPGRKPNYRHRLSSLLLPRVTRPSRNRRDFRVGRHARGAAGEALAERHERVQVPEPPDPEERRAERATSRPPIPNEREHLRSRSCRAQRRFQKRVSTPRCVPGPALAARHTVAAWPLLPTRTSRGRAQCIPRSPAI